MNIREYKKRQKTLLKALGSNSAAIIPTATEKTRNRDADFPFRPDSDFRYITGFNEPESVAVFIPDGKTTGRQSNEKKSQYFLFCRESDPLMEIWNGRREGIEGAKTNYQVDEVFSINELDEILPTLLENVERVYYSIGYDESFDKRLMEWVNSVRKKARTGILAPQEFHSLDHIIHEMRLVKSSAEIKTMRDACKISAKAHIKAMQACQPGVREHVVEAELDHTFTANGCPPAYTSIVGSGENGCILHYTENNAVLKDGDLLLIDAGAELDCYASDITRTFPVNGKFSPEQKIVYEIVLEAQLAAIKKVKPGNHWNQPHEAAVKVLTKGLLDIGLLKGDLNKLIEDQAYNKFYMHRTGHWLGMDVHDVGDYKINGKWRKLEPGMVLTVEPGLYIAANTKGVAKKWWDIGIRIEDDVLVTKTGFDILSKDTPKTIAEIETVMQKVS
ncbi:MAG: Xaa-Pro aminopeptidase [Gammaproteobacteria bacterium]|nr:Xaa-Pro aminopeptidase [Gammaproteobacteria bacterium]